jgi:hypothetical protein
MSENKQNLDMLSGEKISSYLTVFYSRFFPKIFLSVSGFVVVLIIFGAFEIPGFWRFIGPCLWAAIWVYFQKSVCQLREVWLLDSALIVIDTKNNRRCMIKFEQFSEISEVCFSRPERMIIRFKDPTIFGSQVSFMPSLRMFPVGSHPLWCRLVRLLSIYHNTGETSIPR